MKSIPYVVEQIGPKKKLLQPLLLRNLRTHFLEQVNTKVEDKNQNKEIVKLDYIMGLSYIDTSNIKIIKKDVRET